MLLGLQWAWAVALAQALLSGLEGIIPPGLERHLPPRPSISPPPPPFSRDGLVRGWSHKSWFRWLCLPALQEDHWPESNKQGLLGVLHHHHQVRGAAT